MVKKTITVLVILLSAACLFAYNPPVSGESLDRLSSPTQLASASSAAGGGIFDAGPDSIVFNPALTAFEQRVALDAGYTFLFSTADKSCAGSAFQTGILVPWKWCVGSALLKGSFLPFDEMNAGNTTGLNVGASKEITDHLSVGASVNSGLFWGANADWQLGGNLGVLYHTDAMGVLKNFRLGFSLLNLGKNYSTTTLEGINSSEETGAFPGIVTVRAGVAALLFKTDLFEGGFSFDLAAPSFQNLIIDTGMQFSFNNALYLNIAEDINVRESTAGHSNYMPAISIGYKFVLNSKNNKYMEKNGWQESEMRTDTGWQMMYGTVSACSADVKMKLGMQDTQPPIIELWTNDGGK